jgi:aspartate kinase
MIKVMKFGGTSVATEGSRLKIVEKVKQEIAKGFQPVVVVSAIGRKGDPYATDTLIHLLQDPLKALESRDLDLLMSCGEIISTVVVSNLFQAHGLCSIAITGFQAGIVTDSQFGKADVQQVNPARLLSLVEAGFIPVVAGFQGIDAFGDITTLGRGGSDTTAALLGVALDAAEVDIYTDVDGVMTADPRVVPNAKVIDSIAFSEIYQMAIDGAKVVDHKAVSIAMEGNKNLRIKNTFNDTEGTLISENIDYEVVEYASDQLLFTAFTHKHHILQAILLIDGHDESINETLLDDFEKAGISMDMINFFTEKKIFTIHENKREALVEILERLKIPYHLEENLSKITAVGHRIHGVPGVMKRIIMALSKAHIDILQTADSNTTISCLVRTDEAAKALNTLHDTFKK